MALPCLACISNSLSMKHFQKVLTGNGHECSLKLSIGKVRALHRIDTAPVVYVSAISGFEIGIKVQKGKLHLPVPPPDWFAAVIAHHHLEILVLDLAVCLRSTALPAIHADPCDRMIIATAQISQLP